MNKNNDHAKPLSYWIVQLDKLRHAGSGAWRAYKVGAEKGLSKLAPKFARFKY